MPELWETLVEPDWPEVLARDLLADATNAHGGAERWTTLGVRPDEQALLAEAESAVERSSKVAMLRSVDRSYAEAIAPFVPASNERSLKAEHRFAERQNDGRARDSLRLAQEAARVVAHSDPDAYLVVNPLFDRRERAREALLDRVRTGFEDRFRQEVNRCLGANYGTTWTPRADSGLRHSVVDQEFLPGTVETAGMRALLRTIATVEGGSIGISGHRGVGKSTVLHWLADGHRKRAVVVSAPVTFEPREFLLHLFAETCRRIGGADDEAPVFTAPRRLSRFLDGIRLRALFLAFPLVLMALLAVGIAVPGKSPQQWIAVAVALAGVAGWLALRRVPRAPVGAMGFVVLAGLMLFLNVVREDGVTVPFIQAECGLLLLVVRPHLRLTNHFAPVLTLVSEILGWFLVLAGAAGLAAATFAPTLTAGTSGPVVVAVVCGVAVLCYGRRYRIESWLEVLHGRATGAPEYEEPPPRYEDPTRKRAQEALVGIRYQQSIMSATEETLTAGGPRAMAAATQRDGLQRTWTDHPMTYAELLGRYRDLIRQFAAGGPIMIGIDEIDKIEDAEAAEAFLNTIKGLFGIPKVRYFVTISLDAAATFKRKGSPFREVFDSCFDEVVVLELLDYDDMCRLLNARVIQLPRAFMALVYAMCGGLPRDAVRVLRQLLTAVEDRQTLTLTLAVECLVHRDVTDRLRGYEARAHGTEWEHVTRAAFGRVPKQRGRIGATELDLAIERLGQLLGRGGPLPEDLADTALRAMAAMVVGRAVLVTFGAVETAAGTDAAETVRRLEQTDGAGNINDLAKAYRLIVTRPLQACELAESYRLRHYREPVSTPANGRRVR